MPRKTRAQLQRNVDDLTEKLAQAKQPPVVNTIALAYTMNGQLVSVATSQLNSAAVLRAAKAALMNLVMQIDAALLKAVEDEAGAAAWAGKAAAEKRQAEEDAATDSS